MVRKGARGDSRSLRQPQAGACVRVVWKGCKGGSIQSGTDWGGPCPWFTARPTARFARPSAAPLRARGGFAALRFDSAKTTPEWLRCPHAFLECGAPSYVATLAWGLPVLPVLPVLQPQGRALRLMEHRQPPGQGSDI